ncbi:aspartic peptidase domain-containing protein [Mycena sp. CBHHK59/15]|nr:aspartic peptidase domain-containing protein [Mycena sp. CBHHK59/15]
MHSSPCVLALFLLSATARAAIVDLPIEVHNTWHSVRVGLGTPSVDHLLLFDTGSSSSWVVDVSCDAAECPNGSGYSRTPYDASTSKTSNITGPVSTIEYLGGGITGEAVQDVATLGHLCFKAGFLAVTQSSWSTIAGDGFIGLAFESIAETNAPIFMDSLAQQHLLDLPRFGIYAGNVTASVEWNVTDPINDGVLTIGGDRAAEYALGGESAVKFVELTEPYQVWKTGIQATSTEVGTNPSQSQNLSGTSIVFDTGSTFIQVPNSIIAPLYVSLGMNYASFFSGHLPACALFNSSWSFSLVISPTVTYTLTGDKLVNPGIAGQADLCWPPFESGGEGIVIVGWEWIRNFYSVWDLQSQAGGRGVPRVGFAPLKPGKYSRSARTEYISLGISVAS